MSKKQLLAKNTKAVVSTVDRLLQRLLFVFPVMTDVGSVGGLITSCQGQAEAQLVVYCFNKWPK